MKWIVLLLLLGVARGIIFPDYRFGPNLIIIPFATPFIFGALTSWLLVTGRLKKLPAIFGALLTMYFSVVIGTIVYGYSTGWHNVTEDLVSQAVMQVTILTQTVAYFVSLTLANKVLGSRYNKANQKWT